MLRLLRHGIRAATRPLSESVIIATNNACGIAPTVRLVSSTSTDDPLSVICNATDSLGDFAKEIRRISDKINNHIILPSGQQATVKDIAMHSRDADLAAFASPAAVSARSTVLPVAESIERSLQEASKKYTREIQPQMEFANKICVDTPCGGATWEVDFDSSQGGKVRVEQSDTPCGRLQKASLDFIQLSFETRFDMAIGCRAAVLLRLASKFGAPLRVVRNNREQKEEMNRVFRKEMVVTPWVRSEEEYKEYFRIRDDMKKDLRHWGEKDTDDDAQLK